MRHRTLGLSDLGRPPGTHPARDLRRQLLDFRNLTLDEFTTRAEVARLHTALVYEHFGESAWPNYHLQE